MRVAAVLVALVGGVLWLAHRPRPPRLFRYLPPPFWCYALPMIAATIGWLPHQSSVYALLTRYALPVCLIMLLLGTDVRAIAALGPVALGAMAAATAGIMLGAPLSLALFQRWLPASTWMGVGALSGSWIGGSANMLAVKESLGVPADVFTPMIVVDTVLAYAWMGGLIALAGWQSSLDRWLRARAAWLATLQRAAATPERTTTSRHSRVLIAVTAVLLGIGCVWLGRRLPALGAFISHSTWTVLLATALGVGWSCHRWTRERAHTSAAAGTFLLYLLLAAIGGSADLRSVTQAPLLLVVGVVWLAIHGAVLLLVGRLCSIPVFFLATASQANVGGPASAPIVASVYQPALAGVGLLLAVLGNIVGTGLGLATAWLCRAVAAAHGLL